MVCLCCGAAADVGSLCRTCAHDVPVCEGLIAEHVRSNVDTADAQAWFVDGFGAAHEIAAKTAIGRTQDGELVVLASSVSREHAELVKKDGAWTIKDLGSRNGTFVDGVRVQGRSTLPARSVVKIGDVALWFLADVAHQPAAVSYATESVGGGLVRFNFASGAVELCLVGTTDQAAGGALMSRTAGAAWIERGLAPLEYQLLRALCNRAVEEAASPSAVRGCVATKQLARDLPFQSKYANEENVRQVVRRLRGELDEIGVAGLLAVAPGRGYYLASAVSVGPDRP